MSSIVLLVRRRRFGSYRSGYSGIQMLYTDTDQLIDTFTERTRIRKFPLRQHKERFDEGEKG